MNRSRLFLLSTLFLALTLSLSVPAASSGYAGEVDNYSDAGICYWKCYPPSSGAYHAYAPNPQSCVKLCNMYCGGPCQVFY
jgi:hypothetical protein